MAEYAFETISPIDALGVGAGDRITVAMGSATRTTVLFLSDGALSITIEDRTVVFGPGFAEVARGRGVTFPDGSWLYIGSSGPDARDFGLTTPSSGAVYAGDGDDDSTVGAGPWLLQGNQGNDAITANASFANTIYGGQGNDGITFAIGPGGQASQFVQGNRGDDTINGGNAADTLLGGQGNDRIIGGQGQDFLNGNLGDDVILGTGLLFGEGGNDTITPGSSGNNTARGGDGDDRIRASALSSGGTESGARNFIYGEAGNDTLGSRSPERDHIDGGSGDDSISNNNVFANEGDVLMGGDGNDTIVATVGEDTLFGGEGADSLAGGAGANWLSGEGGDDFLEAYGQTAAQRLDGGDGADTIRSGSGVDTLTGGAGDDHLAVFGGSGNLVDAGDGDDRISMVSGSAQILCGDGADTVDAVTASPSSIDGGAGADSIRGSTGADTIQGGAGDDAIDSAGGADALFGGAGRDTFIFLNGLAPQPGTAPQIRDWSSEDRIQFHSNFTAPPVYIETSAGDFTAALTIAQTQLAVNDNAIVAVQLGADVIVFSGRSLGSNISGAVVLVGRSLNDIADNNFI